VFCGVVRRCAALCSIVRRFAAFSVRLQALCKQLEFVHMRLLGPKTEGNESCAMNESPRAGSWGLRVARGIGTAARHSLSETTYTDFFFVRDYFVRA